ncbi:MAG TPA: flagellar biosynthetic protein FliR [Planctomycetota bacterium]|nr:flagellar biosynthetic protein FliR [Planctomycetota bacterium]
MELLDTHFLGAFGLVLARTSALVVAAPLLGQGVGSSSARIALIFGVAYVLHLALGEPLPPGVDVAAYAAMLLREVLLGLFLALCLQLLVLAAHVGGEVIGLEMGFQMASQVDPESGVSLPLVSRVHETLFLLALLSVDGHHWLLRALSDSFGRAPIGSFAIDADLGPFLSRLFAEMFAAGLAFAAPVMVLLALTSVLVGLLSRAVPHINVLELGFTLRIGLALVAMFVFAPLLAPALEGLLGGFRGWLGGALDALEA